MLDFQKENGSMKKIYGTLIIAVLLITGSLVCFTGTASGEKDPVIGIAWRNDTSSKLNVCRAIEEAGGKWVMLDQVLSADLDYDDKGKLTDSKTKIGMLDETGAKCVRCNTWHNSNAKEAVGDVSIVLFTGGEDISPNLYYTPEQWHGIKSEIDYNAERDVSDYLTMSYCLDHDIPVMGFCRGMQMLSVVSGAEIIQDIPSYFEDISTEYNFEHRSEKSLPGAYKDYYTPHDVEVVKDSFLYEMTGTQLLTGCPSWHHQTVKNVDNTRLVVTGTTDTNGVQMIEAVERTDRTFAAGVQFHPEAAVVKNLDNAENKSEFMDYDSAMSIFEYIVREGYLEGDSNRRNL